MFEWMKTLVFFGLPYGFKKARLTEDGVIETKTGRTSSSEKWLYLVC